MSKKIKIQTPKKKIKKIIIDGNEKEYTRLKVVLVSIITIVLSSACLITATNALFTGDNEVKTHVVTGNLDFEFTRTRLVGQVLNEEGYLEDYESTQLVDLTESGVDAFGINLMVPGSTYVGTFNLKNTGTTAFSSLISFTNLEGENEYLLKQIKVTTEFNDNIVEYTLDQFNTIKLDLGNLTVNTEVDFDIGITLPEATNNDAQDSEVSFDIRLEATQVINK